MSDDFFQQLSHFQIIPDFDQLSRNGATCSISSLNKALPELGRPASEVDDFVLRGPMIEFEGYIDIRPSVIIRTAAELGMVTYEDFSRVCDERDDAESRCMSSRAEAAAYQQELDSLRTAIRNSFQDEPSEDVLDTEYAELPEDL